MANVNLRGDDAAKIVRGLRTCSAQLVRARKQLQSEMAKDIYKRNADEFDRLADLIENSIYGRA